MKTNKSNDYGSNIQNNQKHYSQADTFECGQTTKINITQQSIE
jgi:hypothetical protein